MTVGWGESLLGAPFASCGAGLVASTREPQTPFGADASASLFFWVISGLKFPKFHGGVRCCVVAVEELSQMV